MNESITAQDAAIWGSIALSLSLMIVVVVMTRINMRQRERERELLDERARLFVDLEFLDQLTSAAPPESVADLFVAMSQDCRGCMDGIREAAKFGEYERAETECGALAESCDAFGARALALEARQLKLAFKERDLDLASRLMLDINGTADRTFRTTARHLKDGAKRRAKAA